MTSWGRFSVAGLAAVAVLAAIPAGAQELVYTSNFDDSTVSGFGLNMRTGGVTDTPGSPYGASVGPEQMAASADGSFVYVAAATWYAGGPCGTNYAELDTYKIASGNGRLVPWQATLLPAWCPSAILTTGNDVYVVLENFGENKYGEIAGYESVGGSLKPITGSPFPSPIAVSPGQQPAISGIALSHDGKVLYAADPNDAAGILIFDRSLKTGALLFRDTFNAGAGMEAVTVSPSGKFLAAFPIYGNFVYMYAIGTNGSLTAVPGSPFATPNTNEQTGLAFSPDGKFLALSEQGGVTSLVVNASAQLSVVQGSPFGGGFPAAVTFDPSGKFVIVPGTVFAIDGTSGILTETATFASGNSGVVAVNR